MNSTKQCVNSEPICEVTVHARKKIKTKKKKGRKRRRDETRYPNTHLVSSGLVIFIDFVILLQYYYEKF